MSKLKRLRRRALQKMVVARTFGSHCGLVVAVWVRNWDELVDRAAPRF